MNTLHSTSLTISSKLDALIGIMNWRIILQVTVNLCVPELFTYENTQFLTFSSPVDCII